MSIAISKDVQAAYESIRQEKSGQAWAVFSYDGASDLKVQSEGEDLDELADEFSDGKLQYAFLRVTGKSSNLPKLVLVGWCGEGAARKGSFQTHFASVAKQLAGYHVQITARSAEDVAADSIVKKVEDASGAKYTPAAGGGVSETTPKRSTNSLVAQLKKGQLGKTEPRLPAAAPKPAFASKPSTGNVKSSEDEWAPKSKPAAISQPTRQNDATPQTATQSTQDKVEPVKSTYTPIGAPDIAALRAQGNSDRSAPASSQSRPDAAGTSYQPAAVPETGSLKDRMAAFKQAASSPSSDGGSGATKTPPKKTNPLASRFGAGAAAGSRSGIVPATGYESKALGGMSRNFGSEGGKTPAQLWAERKARERGEEVPEHVAPKPVKATVYGDRDAEDEEDKTDVSAVRDRLAGASIKQSAPEPEEEEDDEPAQPPPPPMNTRPQAAKAAVRAPSPDPEPGPEPEEEEEDVHEPEPEPEAAAPKPMENSIKAQLERQLGAGSSPAKGPPAETQRAAAAAPKAKAQDQGQRARVTYEYEAAEEGELSLVEGDVITHIDQVDEGWWQGRDASGAEGLFPANYVELIDGDDEANEAEEEAAAPAPAPAAAAPKSSAPPAAVEEEEGAHAGDSAVAVYEYEAAEEGEIGFTEGERITHIQQIDPGWWQGRNAAGEEGLFPATYVELQ